MRLPEDSKEGRFLAEVKRSAQNAKPLLKSVRWKIQASHCHHGIEHVVRLLDDALRLFRVQFEKQVVS
jgi:hypothetical protein